MTLSPKVSSVRLNLPDVDQAFPFLFDAMIELQAAVARHDEKDEIKSHLSNCVAQAIAIFRREEEAMEITRDRMALSHRSAHKKLLGSLQRIQKQLEEGGPSIGLAQDVRRDIIDWIADHHLLMDASLGCHIQAMIERSRERMSSN